MKNESTVTDFENFFTPEELDLLNFTDEEYDLIEKAFDISKTTEILPEKPEDLLKKIDKVFGNLSEEEIKTKTEELVKTDPEFIKQIVALYSLVALDSAVPEQNASVEKVSLDEIKEYKSADEKKKDEEMMASIIATLKAGASDEE